MQSPRRSGRSMDPSDMRVFEGRYFNINRKLLMCLGLWPYEYKYKKYAIRIIVIGIQILLSVPQLIDVIVQTEYVDRRMMGIVGFSTVITMILKMIGMIITEDTIKKALRSIANNWQLIQNENERELLHIYSERARTGTIVYLIIMMGSATFACTIPSIPKILDKIMPLEKPRTEIYLIEGEYFIDKKAHFMMFFFINYFAIMFNAFISVVFETMYTVSVEQCCALYAVVRYRLVMLRRTVQKSSSATRDGDSYQWLLQTIQLHQHALAHTSLLNDSYSTTFLFIMIAALFVIPLSCCAIISQLDNPLHCITYAIYAMLVLIQGLYLFGSAQRIIDHQLSVYDDAYFNEWYETPIRTKKLLLIFILRCSKPVTITAGGLLEMNLPLYFKIAKTAFSYVAVASSFR